MATTFVDYAGDGNNNKAFSFPSYQESDIKVHVDGVIKTTSTHYNITSYTTSGGGTVVFTAGNIPAVGEDIRIFRDTDVDSAKATFTAGSAVKAADLNNNTTQLLYAQQEEKNQNLTTDDLKDNIITSAKIVGDAVNSAHLADNSVGSSELQSDSVGTTQIKDNAVTSAKIAADAVGSAQIADGAVGASAIAADAVRAAQIQDGAVGSSEIAADAVGSAQIVADAVGSSEIADNAVGSAQIAADAVGSAQISDGAVGSSEIAADAVGAAQLADGAVGSAALAADSVGSAQISDGAVGSSEIAADAVGSAQIADGAVGSAALAADSVGAAQIADGAVGSAALAADSVGSAQISDGAVGASEIAADAVGSAQIQDGAVGSSEIAADAVGNVQIADNAVASANITADAVGSAQIADGAVGSAALDADSVGTVQLKDNAVTMAEIGCEETTITDDDTKLPTSGAVVDYVAAQIAPIGGLEVIATEVAFPATASQPSAGVVISIADAGGTVFNGSGVSTTGRTTDGTPATVTISGAPSSLYSETLAAGVGMQVSSTGSGNNYTYHKILATESDVKQLSDDINDFNARYRIASSAPGSANDEGDLYFDTTSNKMYVYDGSAWGQVTSTGEFKILGVKDNGQAHNGTGPTFNGSNDQYDLFESTSDASIDQASQLIVVLNGVVQKPNDGSWSGSEEGFYLDGSDGIRFCDPPPTGSTLFVTKCGSGVSIPTPGDNTVTAAKTDISLVQGDIIYSNGTDSWTRLAKGSAGEVLKMNSGASAPEWGSAADATKMPLAGGTFTGDVTFDNGTNAGKDMVWDESDDTLKLSDDVSISLGSDRDIRLYHTGSHGYINVVTGDLNIRTNSTEPAIVCTANGSVAAYHDNAKKFETSATGATVTGTLATTAVTGDGSGLTNLPASGVPNNLLINGSMQVAQRQTSLTMAHDGTTSGFGVDRWALQMHNADEFDGTLAQVADGPAGFTKALKWTTGTAESAIAVDEYVMVRQHIESQNLQHLNWGTANAQAVMLSFWVKSSQTGTYGCSFYSGRSSATRVINTTYAISSADTWEKKTITIAGDTAGTVMNNDADAGLSIIFPLAAGSNYDGTNSTSWANYSTANYLGGHAQDGVVTTGSATWLITGVQLETGSTAGTFDYKTYGEELTECSRYYWKTLADNNKFFPGLGMADTDGNTVILNTPFPVRMRAAPSSLEQTGTDSDYKIRRSTTATCDSVPAFGHATVDQAATNFISSSHGFGDGSAVRCMGGATNAYLGWNAEI